MHRIPLVLLAILAATPAAAAQPVAPAAPVSASESGRARFQGLFVDWNDASRASIEAEREAAARPAPSPNVAAAASAVAASAPGSVALGERVGAIVALGDCAEGERVARTAGDFALVAAVRNYCTAPAEALR